MAKVLAISSQVLYGHVGNSAADFVLKRLGHDTICVPTVLLSNRPGYEAMAGERIEPGKLDGLLNAIWKNGWLHDVNAVVTGYVPSPEHARLCERWILRIKTVNPAVLYLCDPIIGDDPGGIYVSEDAAGAIKTVLLQLADILTPNRFELAWLSGLQVRNSSEAREAAKAFAPKVVVVTSAPSEVEAHVSNILFDGSGAFATESPLEISHAHGTGDFFAANFLGRRLAGFDNKTALRAASAAIGQVLAASRGMAEINLTGTQTEWASESPLLAPLRILEAEA